jgi:ATP-dependent DNA helicase DinG
LMDGIVNSASTESPLAPGGIFSSRVRGFTHRAGQQEMAGAIDEALKNRESLVIEAGTGIGKTFAYLVPLFQSGRRALIATATKHLQEQLCRVDIPEVSAVLGRRPSIALLKGRSNYYCPYYAEYHYHNLHPSSRVNKSLLAELIEWARHNPDGDMDGLPVDDVVRAHVTSQSDTCLGKLCPKALRCPLLRAKEKASVADITVINHHLLLANDALGDETGIDLFANVEAVVVDECHQLVEAASQFYGSKLNSLHWQRVLREITGTIRVDYNDMAFVLDAVSQVEVCFDRLYRCLARSSHCLWVQMACENTQLLQLAQDLCRGLDELGQIMQVVKLVSCELRERGFVMHLLAASPYERLRKLLGKNSRSWIFTSATLPPGKSKTAFIEGLNMAQDQCLYIASPFDYHQQAMLYVPGELPDPGIADYSEQVALKMLPLIRASGGRALCLFTSRRALETACGLLSKELDNPLFVQGRAEKRQLVDDFVRSGDGVLLGLRSFWEGLDIPGPALSCVIIDKLPFPRPDDPVVRAHSAAINYAGGQAFQDYQLPIAILRLRQGMGRLLRKNSDRGVIMIADPRLCSRTYGEHFMESLPEMPLTRDFARVQQFLDSHDAAADVTP